MAFRSFSWMFLVTWLLPFVCFGGDNHSNRPKKLAEELYSEMRGALTYLNDEQAKSTIVKHVSKADFEQLYHLASKDPSNSVVAQVRSEAIEEYRKLGMPDDGFSAPPDLSKREVKRIVFDRYMNQLRTEISPLDDISGDQTREVIGIQRLKGEWACHMVANKTVLLIGKKGTTAYDSNNFTPAMIHNNVARVLLDHPQLADANTLQLLDLAFDVVMTYQENQGFNFWPPQYKPFAIWPMVPERFIKDRVRHPTQFELKGTYVNKPANVTNDADDTALAYELITLNGQVKKNQAKSPRAVQPWYPEKVGSVFSPWRDLNRRFGPHPYNRLNGGYKETGAFLTWLKQEQNSFFGVLMDAEWDETGIHDGVNDIDCVVNANVLTTLALNDELDTQGVESACNYLNRVTLKPKDIRTCGLYYPNPYHLHYAVGRAYASGAKCLEPSRNRLLEALRKEQLPDGSWPGGPTKEPLQSTLYAANAMLMMTDNFKKDEDVIERSMKFIRNQARRDGKRIFWPAGVFFSGGFFIRDRLIWKSEPYSTSLALAALSKYAKAIDHKN